ncbi:MAG: heme exporter protein CcmB [Pseudomonadota bacterium]
MKPFLVLLKRDIWLSVRDGGSIITALGFYVIVITFLPLGLGPDANLLSRIAPGLVWIALVLSLLLSMNRIFAHDFEDGSLEVILLGALSVESVVVAKSLAHWITHGLPLAIFAPLLGALLHLEANGFILLSFTTLVGTIALSFLGAIGAALTLGIKQGGLLMPLLILPFYIPFLIFGTGTVAAMLSGPGSFVQPLMILCGLTLAALVLSPIASAAALRINMQ